MIRRLWNAVAAFLVGVAIASTGVEANGLGNPEGTVVLTVTGTLTETNLGDAAQFDIAMLEALGSTEFESTTIWTEGVQRFRGVSLATLIDALGIKSGTLRAKAINDYMVEIPVKDASEDRSMIAYELNGEPMTLRNKGPLWIVYPYDSKSEYRSELTYGRSIWQLDRIEVIQ